MQDLTLEQAQSIAAQDRRKAAQDFEAHPICVAACDDRGLLLDFARMEVAPARSVRISQAMLDRLHRERIEVEYFCDLELTALPGGSTQTKHDGRELCTVTPYVRTPRWRPKTRHRGPGGERLSAGNP